MNPREPEIDEVAWEERAEEPMTEREKKRHTLKIVIIVLVCIAVFIGLIFLGRGLYQTLILDKGLN